jgi:hypothetical protein
LGSFQFARLVFTAVPAPGMIADSGATWVLHFGLKGIAPWCNPTEFSVSQQFFD